ncbi:hypothetical protein AAVH_05410 [Aphelenchoides avenae]|nr:hypothetical protein AAVH_05410 [Aphelenchus avenae]
MVEYDLGEFGRVWVKRSIAKDGCADASEAIDISARTTAVTQSSVASETSRQPGELLILPAYGRCTQPKTISITAVSRNRKRRAPIAKRPIAPNPSSQQKPKGITFDELREFISNIGMHWNDFTQRFRCPVCSVQWYNAKKYDSARHILHHLNDPSYHPYKCPLAQCRYTNMMFQPVQNHVRSGHKLPWTKEMVAQFPCVERVEMRV